MSKNNDTRDQRHPRARRLDDVKAGFSGNFSDLGGRTGFPLAHCGEIQAKIAVADGGRRPIARQRLGQNKAPALWKTGMRGGQNSERRFVIMVMQDADEGRGFARFGQRIGQK